MGFIGNFFKNASKSTAGVILNPAGYLFNKKSADYYVTQYIQSNPINLPNTYTPEQYDRARNSFISGCASYVKSQDVTINRTKASEQCQSQFEGNSSVKRVISSTNYDEFQQQKEAEQMTEKIAVVIFALIMLGIIIWLLK